MTTLSLPMLAQAQYEYNQWAVLAILFLMAAAFAVFNVVLSSSLGPRRKGKVKDDPYESGVDPAGSTRQRFNVRFYLVAMIFLVFDVEVLFLIPWVVLLPNYHALGIGEWISYGALFAVGMVFMVILILGYFYDWGKGVLNWD